MILPPLASSLLLAPGLRKFRTAPVMASASGFLGGSASGIGPRVMLVWTFHASHIFSFGSVSCVPYHPFFHRKQSRYGKNSLFRRMQVYKQSTSGPNITKWFQKCSCKRTSPLKESSQELPSLKNGHLAWCAASKILPRSMLFTPTTDTAQPRRAMTWGVGSDRTDQCFCLINSGKNQN